VVWLGSNLAYELMLLLCGVNMPLASLPAWLATVGRVLPLAHGVQAAREVAAGSGPCPGWTRCSAARH
jgi:ABC-2 type transport system permease protein